MMAMTGLPKPGVRGGGLGCLKQPKGKGCCRPVPNDAQWLSKLKAINNPSVTLL